MDWSEILNAAMDWLVGDDFQKFYAENLRAALFTGFFTLSGFLFAVKAFLIINLKKEVYESPSYLALLERHRKINKDLTHYGPLLRLSGLLFASIALSFITSVCQITIGLMTYNWAAAICLGMSLITVIVVSIVLLVLRKNIVAWLRQLEIDSASNKAKTST